ncbi:hypothetical protein UlMin_045778 [Ulmus minor]
MAAFHILCHNQVFKFSPNSFRKTSLLSFSSNRFSSFGLKARFFETSALKFLVSATKQVEIVFNPDERINKLADEVDQDAPLSRLTMFSPCKINVFLKITNKREDGFHDLASLFHVVNLVDILKFSLSPSKTEDFLSTNAPGIPLNDRNLALNLYRKKTDTGLGGGSSNAASEKELQEWSSETGSYVQNILPPVPFRHPSFINPLALICKNLISVGQLASEGYTAIFHDENWKISKDLKFILLGHVSVLCALPKTCREDQFRQRPRFQHSSCHPNSRGITSLTNGGGSHII